MLHYELDWVFFPACGEKVANCFVDASGSIVKLKSGCSPGYFYQSGQCGGKQNND